MNTTALSAKAHFWLKFEDGEYKNWAAPRDFGTQWFVLRNLYPNSPKAKATNKKRAPPVPPIDSSDEDITLAELCRKRAGVQEEISGSISEDEIGAIRVRSAVSHRAPPSPRPGRTRANANPDLQQAEATQRRASPSPRRASPRRARDNADPDLQQAEATRPRASPSPRRGRSNADPDLQQAEATRRAMLIQGGF